MFNNCYELGNNVDIDLDQWDMSNVVSCNNMFSNCPNLGNNAQFRIYGWNLGNCTSCTSMFHGPFGYNITNYTDGGGHDLRVITWGNSNTTINMTNLFYNCYGYNGQDIQWVIYNPNLTNIFYNCYAYEGTNNFINWNIASNSQNEEYESNMLTNTNSLSDARKTIFENLF